MATRDQLVSQFVDLSRPKVSGPRTQTKGSRAGQTYRVKRGASGAAVRVYNPLDGKPAQTAVVPGTRPATPPSPQSGVGLGTLHTAASKAHGGENWVYRRGASGKLIPVRKA